MKHLKIPYQNDALRFGWDIPVLSIINKLKIPSVKARRSHV